MPAQLNLKLARESLAHSIVKNIGRGHGEAQRMVAEFEAFIEAKIKSMQEDPDCEQTKAISQRLNTDHESFAHAS
jgi:hypothetical protein